jgi:transposase
LWSGSKIRLIIAAFAGGMMGAEWRWTSTRSISRGALPDIPPQAIRWGKNCLSPFLYKNRNVIERMFCRLKDFRRVATRYDRNAINFLAAVCIAATVSYWL